MLAVAILVLLLAAQPASSASTSASPSARTTSGSSATAPAAPESPRGVIVTDARGFRFVRAELALGTLSLGLPGDIAAGDTVSGMLSIEAPDGIEIPAASIRIAGETFPASRDVSIAAFRVPPGVATLSLDVLDDSGDVVASGTVPVGVAPADETPRPLPQRCPRRNLFTIDGRFDGDLRNTDVRIGDAWLTPWAESPRRIVIAGPRRLTGRLALDLGDEEWTAHGTIDVIGVEAEPRSKPVTAGESVEITIRVSGLAALAAAEVLTIDLDRWITGEPPSTEALTITPSPPSDVVTLTRSFAVPANGTFNCLARLRNEVSRAQLP